MQRMTHRATRRMKRKTVRPKLRPVFHLGLMRGDWVTANHLLVASIVVGLLGFGIGFAGLAKARSERAKAAQSLSWAKSTGTIIKSGYRTEKRKRTGKGAAFQDDLTVAIPSASYLYSVNGQEMKGGNIWPRRLDTTVAEAESLVAEFPEGSQCTVYYDPANPGHSVLKPGVVDRRWANDIIGWLILGGTLILVLDFGIGYYNHTQRRPLY